MLRAPIAKIPLDRDEGEYAYIAQRSLVGEIPYKTSFDQKPPGTFVIYALIERYIGTSPAAIHWGTQIYTLGTLALVFFLGEKLFSGFVGTLAAFLLALMMADPSIVGVLSSLKCNIFIRGSVDSFAGRRVFGNLFPFLIKPHLLQPHPYGFSL